MKNKGFTLIELLAVIVVLAIIALIATPIILNIISDSEEEANKRSIDLYARAVKNAIASYQLKYAITPGTYTSSSDGKILSMEGIEPLTVEYNGNVYCNTIEIFEDGNIYLANCTVNGKSVEYAYGKSKTLKDNILSNYGGEDNITEINQKDYDHRILTKDYKITIDNGPDYWFGTGYTYNKTTKKYTLTGTVLAYADDCRRGTKGCGKYTFRSFSNTTPGESSVLYEITDFQELESYYATANVIKYTHEMGIPPTKDDFGLYKMEDDLGTSYYFRGNVTNNYVKLGTWKEEISEYLPDGFTEYGGYSSYESCMSEIEYGAPWSNCIENKIVEKGDSMYWRIVRINGDGTIRMIYDGTKAVPNGTEHLSIIGKAGYSSKSGWYTYNTSNVDATQIDSPIKSKLDVWYDLHLEEEYGKYIADGIFCNDREIFSDTGSYQYFAANNRLSNSNPKLTCTNKNDRYTMSNEIGNGVLVNPIGLITADEVVLAGAISYNDGSHYLSNVSEPYWTLSPSIAGNSNFVYGVSGSTVTTFHYSVGAGIRPVINLKSDVKFTGSGTIDDPYVIVIE